MNNKKITIIGDGAMGTVCAMLLCSKNIKAEIWGFDPEILEVFNKKRENTKFLPGYKLPHNLVFNGDDSKVMTGANIIVNAVPCQYMRPVWNRLAEFVPENTPIVSVTKGIENETLLRPSEILREIIGNNRLYASLSGPTIADELARNLPATACIACPSINFASEAQKIFSTPTFRVYSNDDLIGVELAGAMKNVIAIAAGIIDGKKLGDNAKAALLTRGLTEITRLGIAMGAKTHTFAGLTGLGDLVTTCISPLGRNRSFGERIGKGMNAQEALKATNSVVEGAATCQSVKGLADKFKIEMPITFSVYNIINGKTTVSEAVYELMQRDLKSE